MNAPNQRAPMRMLVFCPHFDPDTAPTGRIMSRIVAEWVQRGHQVEVVTALPWYRSHQVEPGWRGRLWRREITEWGSITRLHPLAGADKSNLVMRALGFIGFSAHALLQGMWIAGRSRRNGPRIDVIIAMSPPLTLGLVGAAIARMTRRPLVFNIQDVFPDAVVATGAVTNRYLIAAARWLEKLSYRLSSAVTVLSEDLARNLRAKVPAERAGDIVVIPNFVDTAAIRPGDRMTAYRQEQGIGSEPVVMYAGNIGFSQSLEMVIAAARACPEATFVFNGDGAARGELMMKAAGLNNIRFVDPQPMERLSEVLATGDLHLVPLRAGLGAVSVPSKVYSILAAGRPVLAAIDADTEIPRILAASGAGQAVAPDDEVAFVAAVRTMIADSNALTQLGAAARIWVAQAASPAAVAAQYEELFARVRCHLKPEIAR
jgi:colanic acid biosynthesis glycosyl transferase WcaI